MNSMVEIRFPAVRAAALVLGKELLMPVFGYVGAGCTSQQPAVSKAG